MALLTTFFLPELARHNGNIETLWFQQSHDTYGTFFNEHGACCFPRRLLSMFVDSQWSSVSPDLTAPDFFLWGYLKAKVYARRLSDINSLKNAIREEIACVTPDTLQRVITSVQQCTDVNGRHLKDVIKKKIRLKITVMPSLNLTAPSSETSQYQSTMKEPVHTCGVTARLAAKPGGPSSIPGRGKLLG
ncbi:hypothetical protein ANN_14118 [Periplaneta americana]|uniref:Uncharacterized protein n=1 Tax=Periplaneta americana TaxID=6978 RepID=A0ABQ8SVF0_PERAM|nr:hypothetical protein ANN_14118 [Periplaneta americana]